MKEDNINQFYLKKGFESLNISQKTLIEDLDVSQQYISAIINGKKAIGRNMATKLSRLYGLNLHWLLTGDGEMKINQKNNDFVAPQDVSNLRINDRFMKILDHYGYSGYRLSQEIPNLSQVRIAHVRNKRNKPSLDLINIILQKFPLVNKDWLINGQGTMLVDSNEVEFQNSNLLENKIPYYTTEHVADLTINERIKLFIQSILKITPYQFSIRLGKKRPDWIYRIIKNEVSPSPKTLNEIFKVFPESKSFILIGHLTIPNQHDNDCKTSTINGFYISEKDALEIISYLEIIKKYSSLVEKKMNACQGGVGTAQSERTKSKNQIKANLEAEIRARFKK
ncbi:helix-turn-helix transcriptional regulator [Chryseobacterium aquaticum]|uniref:HTH cro/C1-type domain-containing protein n=1 Tax=Chryseobacterium aquaticum subsp. greenlandense TaxID=345663 RepID=A0A117KAC7_9FLAO|nr:helix-turn-helix transcriptional regulator [Chryseobacterium aquaticum]KUJ53998.1 hypothetical protein AR686_17580 [Chryseobacterium aquaticum subsp. greenlandense]